MKYSGAEHEVSHDIHQIHEVDHAERSRGLQQMSRVSLYQMVLPFLVCIINLATKTGRLSDK